MIVAKPFVPASNNSLLTLVLFIAFVVAVVALFYIAKNSNSSITQSEAKENTLTASEKMS